MQSTGIKPIDAITQFIEPLLLHIEIHHLCDFVSTTNNALQLLLMQYAGESINTRSYVYKYE